MSEARMHQNLELSGILVAYVIYLSHVTSNFVFTLQDQTN